MLKAEGYRWNTTGWKAWCRTYPVEGFSIEEFFAKAIWISDADGIEVRLYDDLETQIAVYRVEKGQWN
jgi:DNA helicase IV